MLTFKFVLFHQLYEIHKYTQFKFTVKISSSTPKKMQK